MFVKTVNGVIFEKEIEAKKERQENALQNEIEQRSTQALENSQSFEISTYEEHKQNNSLYVVLGSLLIVVLSLITSGKNGSSNFHIFFILFFVIIGFFLFFGKFARSIGNLSEDDPSFFRVDYNGINHARHGFFEWKNIDSISLSKRVVKGFEYVFLLVIARLPSPYIDDINNVYGERKEFYLDGLSEEKIRIAIEVGKVFAEQAKTKRSLLSDTPPSNA